MGSFLVECSAQQLSCQINHWVKEFRGSKHKRETDPDIILNHKEFLSISAVFRSSLFFGVKASWELYPKGTTRSLLKMDVKPVNYIIVLLVIIWILNSIIAINFASNLYSLTYSRLSNFTIQQVNRLVLNYVWIGILLCFNLWLPYVIKKRLVNFENSFWRFLGEHYEVKFISGIAPEVFPLSLCALGDIGLLSLTGYLFYPFGVPALCVVFVFYGMGRIIKYTKLLLKRNPYEEWKIRLLILLDRWSQWYSNIVSTIILLVIINQMAFTMDHFDKVLNRDTEVKNLIRITTCGESFRRQHVDLEKENIEITRNILIRLYGENIMAVMGAKLIHIAYLFLLSLSFIFFFFRSMSYLLSAPKDWQSSFGKSQLLNLRYFPFLENQNKIKEKNTIKILMLYYVIFLSFVNLASIIFSIDGLAYLLLKNSIIFKESGILFSWIFSIAKDVLGKSLGTLFSELFIIGLISPFIFFCLAFIRKILKSISRTFFTPKLPVLGKPNGTKIKVLNSFLSKTCQDTGMVAPELFITPEPYIRTFIKGSLLKKRPIIYISLGSIEKLEKEELVAMIAHELGHLKNDLRKIEWCKALSIFTFFPNYYWTLLLDTRNYELEADCFSTKMTGDGEALVKAIVKASVLNLEIEKMRFGFIENVYNKLSSYGWRKLASLLKRLAISAEFFLGEGLLEYAYPPLNMRIAYIRGLNG